MNKFYLTGIIAIFLLPLGANATHMYGAQITATAESCQANTYSITITGYGDTGFEVDFVGGVLDLGFGDPIQLHTETDFSSQIVNVDNCSLRISKLELNNVIFPGPGTYTINFREFNRNADVVNIRNSVDTPLYIESSLLIDPLLCNNTPQLSDSINFLAFTGSAFQQQLGIFDPDGDSLSLELVIPQENIDAPVAYLGTPLEIDMTYADNPTNAEGTGDPTFTLDTSALVWNAPNLPGEFAVALRINEWREVNGEWISLGFVTRDFTIQVLDTVNNISFTDIITSTPQAAPDEPTVQLFPNPNQGDFTLEVNEDAWSGATASIHNIIGLEIDRRTVYFGQNSYNVADCKPGIYFLTLQQGDLQRVLRFMKR